MALIARFVDSIAATATVRLDVNDGDLWRLQATSRFDPPRAKRARVSTLLVDGAQYPATAYDDRTLELRWLLEAETADIVAGEVQKLARELDRPQNFFEYRPDGASQSVFFRTHRLGLDAVDMPTDGTRLWLEVNVPAEPFAYGPEETLSQVVVVNNPVGVPGPTLNANPFFEVNAANWTAFSGTAVRSTAQFHEGVASLLATPDGVAVVQEITSDTVPTVAGRTYRLSGWVRCAVARTIDIFAVWQLIGGGETGSPVLGVAVAANTWTFLDHTVTAPAGTNAARLSFRMTGTPPASHTLHIDEAMLREASGLGSMYFDVTGVKGDVETPMVLRADQADVNGLSGTAIGIRRRGNVADTPFTSQAEAWTLLTDTTLQANDATASGAGQNYVRCSFATNAALVDRMSILFPPVPTPAARGLYRVFVRVRNTGVTGLTRLQLSGSPTGLALIGTSWAWGHLGYVAIPGGTDQAVDFAGQPIDPGQVQLVLQAQRLTGADSLDIDCFVFVPADDGHALVTWSSHGPTGWTVLDGPQDLPYALDSAGRMVPSTPPPTYAGGIPMLTPGVPNRLYVVKRAFGAGADTLTEAVVLDVSYYPRYLYVRPATE